MPRTLVIDPRVPTLHGVLIPRLAIDQHVRTYTMVQEARAHARRIINEAYVQAEAIQEQAYMEGFGAGWIDSLDVIHQKLINSEQLQQQLEQRLKKNVHDAIEHALQQPELELSLIQGWLDTAPATSGDLHVVLPRHIQQQTTSIIRRFEQALGVTPTVSFGDSDHVIIESGVHLFEFSSARISQEMDALTQHCLRQLDIRKQCTQMNGEIVQHWLTQLAQRHGAVLPDISAEAITTMNSDQNQTSSEHTQNGEEQRSNLSDKDTGSDTDSESDNQSDQPDVDSDEIDDLKKKYSLDKDFPQPKERRFFEQEGVLLSEENYVYEDDDDFDDDDDDFFDDVDLNQNWRK